MAFFCGLKTKKYYNKDLRYPKKRIKRKLWTKYRIHVLTQTSLSEQIVNLMR